MKDGSRLFFSSDDHHHCRYDYNDFYYDGFAGCQKR